MTDWVDDYMDIPFSDHGRDRTGCDCYGLVRLVLAERFGVTLPMLTAGYERTADQTGVAELIDATRPTLPLVPVQSPAMGDLVLVRQAGQPCHVGVMVTPHLMLHTEAATGPRLDDIRRVSICHRIEGFYRHG